MSVPDIENPFKVRKARKVSLSSFSNGGSASTTPSSSRSVSPSPASFSLSVQRAPKDDTDRNCASDLSTEQNFIAQLEDLTRHFEAATFTGETTSYSHNTSSSISYEEHWRSEESVEVESSTKRTARPLFQDSSRSYGSISSLMGNHSNSSSTVNDNGDSKISQTCTSPRYKPYNSSEYSTSSSYTSLTQRDSTRTTDTRDNEYSSRIRTTSSTPLSPQYTPFRDIKDSGPHSSHSSARQADTTSSTDSNDSVYSSRIQTISSKPLSSQYKPYINGQESGTHSHSRYNTTTSTKGTGGMDYSFYSGSRSTPHSPPSSPVPHTPVKRSTSSQSYSSNSYADSSSVRDMTERGRIYVRSQPSSRSSSPAGMYTIKPTRAITIVYTSMKTEPKERISDIGRTHSVRTEEEKKREKEERKKKALDKPKGGFILESVDFHKDENEKNHHTDEYEKDDLVVRRGQPFNLTINLKSEKGFDPKKDELLLCFEIGDEPSFSKGTRIYAQVVKSFDGVTGWATRIVSTTTTNTVQVEVMASPSAVVGMYNMIFQTKVERGSYMWTHHQIKPVYILFNAWCKDDVVYMPDEDEREEYVLNENGMIWQHKYTKHKGLAWDFGQFEDVSLDCALYLLHVLSKKKPHTLGNPVVVSRALSALVNCNNEGGVLVGNWSGNYELGTNPSVWNGSVEILTQFMAQKTPVNYGQCWVFSGVLTTLGRTLGIPTRSVTNINSAHDNDGTATIDVFYDAETLEPLESRNDDSIWNFHVWNECWFKRTDLPADYDGWQAVDSTPQEESSGIMFDRIMCCGPAPVKAIKEGELSLGNDALFIYAEVNGDKVVWLVNDDGEESIECIHRNAVGKNMITKKPGKTMTFPYGMDIKDEYKYSGAKEPDVSARAVNHGAGCKFIGELTQNSNKIKDVTFTCNIPDNIVLGGNVSFKLQMKSTSRVARKVSVNIQVRASFYTGVTNPKPCKVEKQTISVPPGGEKEVTLVMTVDDYIDSMYDDKTAFKVYFIANVEETKQKLIKDDVFTFDMPPLIIECPDVVDMNKPFKVKVSFKNMLTRYLDRGVINIQGRHVQNQTLKQRTIDSFDEFSEEFEVACVGGRRKKRAGNSYLRVSFTSKLMSLSADKFVQFTA